MVEIREIPTQDLFDELRSRGLAVSLWKVEDTIAVIEENEDFENHSDAEIELIGASLLSHARRGLEGCLASAGFDYLTAHFATRNAEVVSDANLSGAVAP